MCPLAGKVAIGTYTVPTATLQVDGSFAATTKIFDIAHPDGEDDKRLRHWCIETDVPGGACQYWRTASLLKGANTIDLPSWFDLLCENALVFASPLEHFGLSWGKVVGNIVEVTTSKAGQYNVLICASRKHAAAKACPQEVEYVRESGDQ